MLPLVMIVLLGYGLSVDVKDVQVAVVLDDTGREAMHLAHAFQGSSFIATWTPSMLEAERKVCDHDSDAIVRLSADFGCRLQSSLGADVQMIVHGVNTNYGRGVAAYVVTVIAANRSVVTIHRPSFARRRGCPACPLEISTVARPLSYRMEMRPIRLGPVQGERAVIADGLQAGEIVVTDGVDKLQQGSKVAISRGPTTRGARDRAAATQSRSARHSSDETGRSALGRAAGDAEQQPGQRRLCRIELDVIGLIGIILLIGIVKKNAIMMIDFALDAERNEKKPPREAIYQACLLRFRPIMMTAAAALLGGVPLALGTGTGSELRRPLGITIIGGLLFSQALTLYTTPVIYVAFDKLARRFRRSPEPARADAPVEPAGGALPGRATYRTWSFTA